MTIIEAINGIDAIKPNSYSEENKIGWLSLLDGRIKNEIIDTHTGAEIKEFSKYDGNTPLDTELLAEAPYDDIYIKWLEAQIDYANGEYAKYNNSSLMFNNLFDAYKNYYNRKYVPKGTGFKYF